MRLPNLHQTLAAMFKHCKHREYFSIHKIFRENFSPHRTFFKIPFAFSSPYRLSSSFSSFLPLLSCPLPCLPSPYARTHMHTHVRPYAHMMRALAYARTRTRVIYHPIFSSY
nr:MAG TPA: hypothetical protein [Herelleviridae sp.]